MQFQTVWDLGAQVAFIDDKLQVHAGAIVGIEAKAYSLRSQERPRVDFTYTVRERGVNHQVNESDIFLTLDEANTEAEKRHAKLQEPRGTAFGSVKPEDWYDQPPRKP
jgi:hypothetical protein